MIALTFKTIQQIRGSMIFGGPHISGYSLRTDCVRHCFHCDPDWPWNSCRCSCLEKDIVDKT